MTVESIETRLASLQVTGDPVARVSAADAAEAIFRTAPAPKSRPRPLPAFVALAVAVVVLLVAVTPQGRSVASAAGELVGIGDEPSELPSIAPGEDTKQDGYVIAVGETPNGTPFELSSSTLYESGEKANGTTCTYLSYPTLGGIGGNLSCLTAAALRGIYGSSLDPYAQIGPPELGSDSDLLVTGNAMPKVRSVEIGYTDRAGIAQTATSTIGNVVAGNSGHPHAIGAKPGGQPIRSFVAFLPSTILGEMSDKKMESEDVFDRDPDMERVDRVLDGITVTGYGTDGEVVAAKTLGDIPNLELGLVFQKRGVR